MFKPAAREHRAFTLPYLFDAHAPIKTKTIRAKPINNWFTPAISTLKFARRHIVRLWIRDLHLLTSPTVTQTPTHSHGQISLSNN